MVSNISTPNLVHITELGSNRNAPRFWAESSRLANLGFEPGVNFGVEAAPDGIGLRLRVSPTGERTVSRKRDAGAFRPVIDKTVAEAGAVKSFESMTASAKGLPMVGDGRAMLTDHVLDYALSGIFSYLAEEEAAIRSNPA